MMSSLYRCFIDGHRRTKPMQKWHHYFPIYEQWFAPFRDAPITVLEIGVGAGGSLEMWRSYFTRARVFGIDINPICAGHGDVFIGDQADPIFLRGVTERIGTPTIVIDDGGHTANQTITSFETLYPAMTPTGIYLVEDTHTSFWSGFSDRPEPEKHTFLRFATGKMIELHDWSRQMVYGEVKEPISDFCRETRGVHFYDSIVIFERCPREVPFEEVR